MANYFPCVHEGSTTTPFELFYGSKPDYRLLVRLFSVGFFHHDRDADRQRTMAEAQTMSGLFVGYSDRVDGAMFYCPHTKQVYETADYKLAPSLPPGAFFRLPYDGGLYFGLCDSPLTTPEPFPPGSEVSYLAPSASTPVRAHVLAVPLSPTASGRPVVDTSPSYRLRLADGSLIDADADALSSCDAVSAAALLAPKLPLFAEIPARIVSSNEELELFNQALPLPLLLEDGSVMVG